MEFRTLAKVFLPLGLLFFVVGFVTHVYEFMRVLSIGDLVPDRRIPGDQLPSIHTWPSWMFYIGLGLLILSAVFLRIAKKDQPIALLSKRSVLFSQWGRNVLWVSFAVFAVGIVGIIFFMSSGATGEITFSNGLIFLLLPFLALFGLLIGLLLKIIAFILS